MQFDVYITAGAERDIYDVHSYIALNDSVDNADYVFEKLGQACLSFGHFPLKGHTPPELERIGVLAYREIHFKPYRIIYEIRNNNVFIHAVLDGRRDLQYLMERRLLHK